MSTADNLSPTTALIRAGVVAVSVTFGALTVRPGWALELTTDPTVTEITAVGPQDSLGLDGSKAGDKASLEKGLLRFSVTPAGAVDPTGNGGTP